MIIGLCGYAQSGKDSVAEILVNNYGYTRVAFADPIRELLYEMNPTVKDGGYRLQGVVDGYGWDVAKTAFPEVRALLQNLGVGARKVFGEHFWVHQALRQVHWEGNFVITDVRYPNEAKEIREYDDAQIWRIKRTGIEPVNTHASETAMDGEKVDQIFLNNGTLEDLAVLIGTRMRAYV
jgi:hypothetical protein